MELKVKESGHTILVRTLGDRVTFSIVDPHGVHVWMVPLTPDEALKLGSHIMQKAESLIVKGGMTNENPERQDP